MKFISMVSFTMRCRFSIDSELRKIHSDELVVYDVELSEFISRKLISLKAGTHEPPISAAQAQNIYDRWAQLGDIGAVNTLQEMKRLLKVRYPGYKEGKINITAGQIFRFVTEFKIDDQVITYNPEERLYYIGRIKSNYEFKPNYITDKPHIRRIDWEGTVSRDVLTASARNTLGSIMTIISIPNDVQKELLKQMVTGQTEGTQPSQPIESVQAETEEEAEELELIKEDVIEKSNEFIKDKIAKLDWEQMQELVAGILRGMGYKTRILPKGPDRGRDIFASPDGLGLEEPRIIVEVKHRSGSMGSNQIRSFTGIRGYSIKGRICNFCKHER